MLPSSSIAFKEWAAVCAALEQGRQSLIARKGGIHEGRQGFRVAHSEFWLFPTYLHEQQDGLIDEARSLLDRVVLERPAPGTIRIGLYAEVTDVFEVADPALLANLAGEHVWSPRVLDERFHYRQPGLFVLAVRVHRLPEALVLPDSPHFGGCRSWGDLPAAFSTAGLAPVLTDAAFEQQRSRIRAALTPRDLA